MSHCQKCQRAIGDNHGRWMYVPEGLPIKARFDKCQGCGPWTEYEKAIAAQKITQHLRSLHQPKPMSGCNCTGKR